MNRQKNKYDDVLGDVEQLIQLARQHSTRSVNAIMTATYWAIGRRIVEYDQGGSKRARYGESVLKRLSNDLLRRYGRGFSVDRLELMRQFYTVFPATNISATLSRKSLSTQLLIDTVASKFELPWSHYVLLLRQTLSGNARTFYESEALRGGWTVRQLDRQIESQFYERTLLSKKKTSMLKRGSIALPEDVTTPEEEIKNPFVLEFLNLKDEYSENDLEEALVGKLESFLLELGGDFTFVGRQRRLRVGNQWYKVDLLFFHRSLRCLVVIDLKLGQFNHSDAGQMHLYLNYAKEHWTHKGENPPVGLILCASKNNTVAKYALEGLPNKILAAEYRTALPKERLLVAELEKSRKRLANKQEKARE